MATHKQKIPKKQRHLEVIIKLAIVLFIFSVFFPEFGAADYIENVLMNSLLNIGKWALVIILSVLVLALKREMFLVFGMLIVIVLAGYTIVVKLVESGLEGIDGSLTAYLLVGLLAYHFVQKNERKLNKGRR